MTDSVSSSAARSLTMPKRSSVASHSALSVISAVVAAEDADRSAVGQARAGDQIDEDFRRRLIESDDARPVRRRATTRRSMRSGRSAPYCFETDDSSRIARTADRLRHEPRRRLTSSTMRLDVRERVDLDLDRGEIQAMAPYAIIAVDHRRQDAGVDAGAEERRDDRDRHREGADREDRLACGGDAPVVSRRSVAFGHRVLHGFALADEIEHHHRVREQRDHRGEDAVGDVARDVGAREPEIRRWRPRPSEPMPTAVRSA